MSLNGTLATARSSLELFSLGIQVAGQNIANASTPGYVRETLRIDAATPYRSRSVVVGAGAIASGVTQQLDYFLETRIHSANSDYSASAARSEIYNQLQQTLGELGDSDLSTSLNNFLGAVQDVVNEPDNTSLRSFLVQTGQRFAQDVQFTRGRIEDLQSAQDGRINSLVSEANELIATVERLNPQITALEANGLDRSDAGGLRVQRLTALNRLSEILPVRATERESGAVDLYLGNDYILLDGYSQRLNGVTENIDGQAVLTVQLSGTRSALPTTGGELRAVIDGRDQILGGALDQLDTFVAAIIEQVNRVHSGGEGLKGFTQATSERSVSSTGVPLNAADLPFAPSHGSFQIKLINQSTGVETSHTIAIDLDGIGSDTTLSSLQGQLDGLTNLTASISTDGRLELAADSGFEFRFAGDSSGTLAALGFNTFFSGTSSDTIEVNAELVKDPRLLATGQGGGASDNRNATALASAFSAGVEGLGGVTLQVFYERVIGGIAESASAESALADGFEGFRDSLNTQRQQRSGVSLDEETIKVLELQQSYRAAAQVVSTVDELLNILLNI